MKWKFEYLEKRKPDDSFEFLNTIFGTAFHAVCEALYSKADNRISVDQHEDDIVSGGKKIFLEVMNAEIERVNTEGKKLRYSKGNLASKINDLCFKYTICMHNLIETKWHEEYSEIYPEVEMSAEIDGFKVGGVIDLVCFRSDGTYDLKDFKTGQYYQVKNATDDIQALFYNFLAYSKYKKFPQSFEYLIIRREDMRLERHSVDLKFGFSAINIFYDLVDEFNNIVSKEKFAKLDKAQKNIMCNFCGYRKACFQTP